MGGAGGAGRQLPQVIWPLPPPPAAPSPKVTFLVSSRSNSNFNDIAVLYNIYKSSKV